MTESESPEDQFNLEDPMFFVAYAQKVAETRTRDRRLTDREKVTIAGEEEEVKLKRAKVREARDRAMMELSRQRMTLQERKTHLWITVGLAVFTPLFLVGALLLAPWVIPSTTGIGGAFAYLWRRTGAAS
ncbi:MAG TPA: hypothetical protein VHR18_10935 [Solirubrobacterales bacterium]|nr:hypothetical protein [Solirubrobacterales bacterium]